MNVQPKRCAELHAIRRAQAREHCTDQLRRAVSALNAAIDGEPSSTRSTALHDLRRRVVRMIDEVKAL